MINPTIQKEVDAKRQEIIKEIIRKVNGIILAESDGSTREISKLEDRAATGLLIEALCLELVYRNNDHCRFDDEISKAAYDTIVNSGVKPEEAVRDWIMMQVAKQLIEKVEVPILDRLCEYDNNN